MPPGGCRNHLLALHFAPRRDGGASRSAGR